MAMVPDQLISLQKEYDHYELVKEMIFKFQKKSQVFFFFISSLQ